MPTKLKSPTTTKGARGGGLVQRRLPTDAPPTHPGEMLREGFLVPLGITQSAFAARLGVSFPRLNEVSGRSLRIRRFVSRGCSA